MSGLAEPYIRAGCNLLRRDWGSQLQVHEMEGGQTLARLQAFLMTHRGNAGAGRSEDVLLDIFSLHTHVLYRPNVVKHLCKGTFSQVCVTSLYLT